MTSFYFDPLSPEFRRNPYPFYDRLRHTAPIFYWAEGGGWFLSRYEDCKELLRDKRLGNQPQPGNSMLFQNPPDHTRLRSLVNKAFTPRMVNRYLHRIQAITEDLLNRAEEAEEIEIIADLAYPLPVVVIAEMMGVPSEDHTIFQSWSKTLVQTLDFADTSHLNEAASSAMDDFEDYFQRLIDARRVTPRDDLLSALVAAEEAGDRLSFAELHTTCRLLLIAGHETTVNLIGNGVLALLQHSAQRRLLLMEPSLIVSAVEELLRYDSPIQLVSRTVLETFDYAGYCFQQGEQIRFLIGAANRDPQVFTCPDALDITRQESSHLSFSHGIHYCLGAPLARLEAQIAIQSLFQRRPKLALGTDTLTYVDNFVFRGLTQLPVTG